MHDYAEYDGLGLAELLHRGEVSSDELHRAALQQISLHNEDVNAVVHQFDTGASSSAPFSGVPFLVKDLGMHVQGEPQTSGSRLFSDVVSNHDSTLIQRYKAGGLRLIGKTNTPELGLATTTEPVLHGPTRNPHNLKHSVGGSSGGAAAAVASGMVPMAHASDGGGSIRIPASCCGLVGLKPTRARVPLGPTSLEGWGGLSTTHAITRSVRDSAALLDISSGEESGAPYFAPGGTRSFLLAALRDPPPLRIALSTRAFSGLPTEPEIVDIVQKAAGDCQNLGHKVDAGEVAINADAFRDSHGILAISHVAATIEARLAQLGRPLQDGDVEKVTERNYRSGHELSGAQYAWAQNTARDHGRILAEFFAADVDVLMTPTMAILPPEIGALDMMSDDEATYLDILYGMIGYTALFNDTGLPAISVPLGWSASGLPVGVQFVAPMGQEAVLLALAAQLERAGLFRQKG